MSEDERVERAEAAQGDAPVRDALKEALADLATHVEELRTARGELERQNEELVAARLIAEADRQRYEELFEFAPDGYIVTDTAGTILEANRAAVNLLGGRGRSMTGRSLAAFVASDARGKFRERLQQLLDEGRIDSWSIPIAPRGRPRFPALVTAERVEDAEGAAPGIRWLIRDVTREQRAEQQIAGLSNELEQRIEQRTRELVEIAQLRVQLEEEERRAAEDAARAAAEAERAAAGLRDLQAITDSMLGRLRLDDLLHGLLEQVRQAVGSDTATILLTNPEGLLAVRAEVGSAQENVGEVRVAIGEGVAGTIAARREPMIVPDVIAAGARSRFLRRTISSLVGVPIFSGGEVAGVLHAGSRTPREFTEDDVRLLELVAERAILAIESSRVYEAELEARREAEVAQMRLAFLAEASALLGASLSSPEAFENLARLAVTFLTDLCLIDVVQDDGSVRRVAAVHKDPSKQELARQLQDRFAPDPFGLHPAIAVMRERRSQFAAEMTDDFLRRTTRDAEHYRLVKDLGFQSFICAPLVARGAVLGTLTLVSTSPERRYGPADLSLAEDLARHAGMAIDNARLLDAEQRARVTAERAAARTAVLQSVTAALSETNTAEQVARVVADQILPVVGADAASVALLHEEEGVLEVVADEGYPKDLIARWRRIPLDADVPLVEVTRTREPLFFGSRREMAERYPRLAEAEPTANEAFVAIPIVVRGRVLGAMGLSHPEARQFTTEDRAVMVALARQCGQAMERALLYESEVAAQRQAEAAQQRVAFLGEASRILAETLEYRETPERVARLALAVLADLCVVDLVSAEGTVERVVAAAAEPAIEAVAEELRGAPPSLSGDDPAVVAIRTGVAQFFDEEHEYEQRRRRRTTSALRDPAIHGVMSIPLQARGRTLGAITFVSATSRFRYGEDERALGEALAQRAAVAVDNARLYRERDHIARTLQRSLLPPELPSIPDVELAARYRPAGEGNEVGGDFYDAFPTGGDSWSLVIGDVCGKGPEAAAVTGLARHTLRAATVGERRPSAALRVLNDAMLQRGTEQRFCTVCYVRVHRPPEGMARLTVCCAGHPLPLVLRADGTVEVVGRAGALLGVFADPELSDVPIDLGAGDAVLLYTDGVTEERTDQGFFGFRRLREVLAGCAGMDAESIAGRIEEAVAEFRPAAPRDDLTVVVVRLLPAAGSN